MSQQLKDDMVIMGRFGRPVGIQGQIKLFVFSNCQSNIEDYKPLYIKNTLEQWEVVDCENIKQRDKFLAVSISGINSRDAVQIFTGKEIAVERNVLPTLPDGEYYWRDLIGMNVVNLQSYQLGKVSEILETGANDVLIVKSADKKYLIPFLIDKFVMNINTKENLITVDWDENF